MTRAIPWTAILCTLAVPVKANDLSWTEPGPIETAILYVDGSEIEVQTESVWQYMCGSDTAGLTVDDLRASAERARVAFAPGHETTLISAEPVRGGLNIVFSVSGGLPAGAQEALDAIALYVESVFTDPIMVTINFSMFDFGNPSVLGSTSSNFVSGVAYTTTRTGLVNGMDADDTIQNSLPAGSTVPVRYTYGSATVNNESSISITRANYNATIGSVAGSAATMQVNTGFNWDYDPSNGVPFSIYCFQSVMVHEVGHALGFVSGADQTSNAFRALDLYRFQRSDGTGTDYNPDDLAEFGTYARMVDRDNGTVNDDVNSDLIVDEYRMSDANPWQASHFRSSAQPLWIMDPNLDDGRTFYPNFYRTGDLAMFDAIGWDRLACIPAFFSDQPDSQVIAPGGPVAFSVTPSGTGPFTYQWRKDTVNLADGPAAGGGNITGTDTDTLMIDSVNELDAGSYDCVITGECGGRTSSPAILSICAPVTIDDDPDGQTVDAGDPASFAVLASGTGLSYHWRKGGVDLSDGAAAGGGTISGAETDTLSIDSVGELDEGDYDCVVTGACDAQTSASATLSVNAGVPSAAVTGALSRKNCDLPIASFNGAGPVSDEPRQGGVSELRIAFNVSPAGPGPSPVTIEEATCAAPAYAAYSGAAAVGASIAGNELVLTFTPGLENARTYRVNIGADVTSIAGQFVEIRGLAGDATGDGLVNSGDRSAIVGVWTGSGFSCLTDLTNDGVTNAGDRSAVVGAWTNPSANCAP